MTAASAASVSLEAHAIVLSEELAQLDADLQLLASLQARYAGIIPPLQSGGGKGSARGPTAGRPPSSSSASATRRLLHTPRPHDAAVAYDTSFLAGAMSALHDVQQSKAAQLHTVKTQREVTDNAIRSAAALAEELQHRVSDGAPPVQDHSHLYRPAYSTPYGASSPTRRPPHHYSAAMGRAQIGFEPPYSIDGWVHDGVAPSSSIGLRHAAAGAPDDVLMTRPAHNMTTASPSFYQPDTVRIRPSPTSTPMLVVLPQASHTNLTVGVTPALHQR